MYLFWTGHTNRVTHCGLLVWLLPELHVLKVHPRWSRCPVSVLSWPSDTAVCAYSILFTRSLVDGHPSMCTPGDCDQCCCGHSCTRFCVDMSSCPGCTPVVELWVAYNCIHPSVALGCSHSSCSILSVQRLSSPGRGASCPGHVCRGYRLSAWIVCWLGRS